MSARLNANKQRDASTIEMLKETYVPGTKVEAVRVKDLKSGTMGIVKEVKNNGDIAVMWSNGTIANVEFGIDSMRIITDGKCYLKRTPESSGCSGTACSECGWNEKVHLERIRQIRNGGLVERTVGNRTMLTLIVKKKGGVSTEQNC